MEQSEDNSDLPGTKAVSPEAESDAGGTSKSTVSVDSDRCTANNMGELSLCADIRQDLD